MYRSYQLLRFILFPFVRYLLPLFSGSIRKRIELEQKYNGQENLFGAAEYAFEVSSEGELEQVMPVICHFLEQDIRVELLFSSSSVENKICDLKQQFPSLLRVRMLPLIHYHPFTRIYNPKDWLQAKTFFLCRYDFFPELMSYGQQQDVHFILLSGAIKNFQKKNRVKL